MRTRFGWLILAAALLGPTVAPTRAWAQNGYYEVPPAHFTGPLSHPRYETGGFFVGMEALMWFQDRPVLSVLGSETKPAWVETAAFLRASLPHVEELTIDGVGHLLHIQDAEPVARGIAAFLERNAMAEGRDRPVAQAGRH